MGVGMGTCPWLLPEWGRRASAVKGMTQQAAHFTFSRIHDNKVPCPLPASAIEYLIDRCPNVNPSLSGKQSRSFAFSFFILHLHTVCSLAGSQDMHTLYFVHECLYVLLLLFELTSALTASLLLYLASVFLYVIRISRDRSAIQSWAIFYSKRTVLIHLLGLKEALDLKYHSLFHIRASTWRFNHSNGQRLTAHLHRSRGQCIGCVSEKEIECYFLVVIIYLSFRIETCRSMVWIMHVKAGRISLCVYLRIFGAVIYECVCIYFKQPRVHIFVLLEKENSMHDIQYNILWYYLLSSFIDMLTL